MGGTDQRIFMNNKRVLILGNSHLVVFGFRGELIKRLVKDGYDVTVAFPNGPFGEGEKTSKEYGCHFIETPMNRRGANPFQEFKLSLKYIELIKSLSPSVVLAYTVKCDVYGGIACRVLGIPFIPNITGLGKGLADGGLTAIITKLLYKAGIKNSRIVFFQNTEDKKFFDNSSINYNEGIVLPGSGVNLQKFQPLPYPKSEKVVFTYIGRIMKAKGIEQFLDAARCLKEERINAEFHVCGFCEENYKKIMDDEQKAGTIIYHGLVNNILDFERISHCVVLPSFHPEGISNVLLEAAACARPIITTDRAGCRETVDDGKTGYLVKEADSGDLIEKIKMFMNLSNTQREEMGLAGRKKIENEFDRNAVVEAYVKQIEALEYV